MSISAEPFRIAFAGDWHANTRYAVSAIRYCADHKAEAIIHTGDFGYTYEKSYVKTLGETLAACKLPLFFVDGNHDWLRRIWSRYPKTLRGLFELTPYLHYLPRGFRWEWGEVKFLAMGGAYSVDRDLRTPGVSWWPTEQITADQVRRVSRDGHAHVLVSHDCPALVTIPGIDNRPLGQAPWPLHHLQRADAHRRRLFHLVEQVRPQAIWHGHYHRRYQQWADFGYGPVNVNGLDCDGADLEDNIHVVNLHDLMMEFSVGPFGLDKWGGVSVRPASEPRP